MAAIPVIRAIRNKSINKPATADIREALAVDDKEKIGYRRVELTCGKHILSEADNWYVPSRLTPEMNLLLDTTETPFGTAVKALHFSRHTLDLTLLWSPLPNNWGLLLPKVPNGNGPLAIPSLVLQNRAVLLINGNQPISLVVKSYRRGNNADRSQQQTAFALAIGNT